MSPQLLSIISSAVMMAGTYMAATGGSHEPVTTVPGAVAAIAATAWKLWTHRQTGIIADAAALPGVHQITADRAIADSPAFASNPIVVAPGQRAPGVK